MGNWDICEHACVCVYSQRGISYVPIWLLAIKVCITIDDVHLYFHARRSADIHSSTPNTLMLLLKDRAAFPFVSFLCDMYMINIIAAETLTHSYNNRFSTLHFHNEQKQTKKKLPRGIVQVKYKLRHKFWYISCQDWLGMQPILPGLPVFYKYLSGHGHVNRQRVPFIVCTRR